MKHTHDITVASIWASVRVQLHLSARATGLGNMEKITEDEIAELDNILQKEIPKLRRMAAIDDDTDNDEGLRS